MVPETELALAKMTDEGLFERVATAALRVGDARYVSLAHPGVNVKGMTRKSPVDGVTFIPGTDPPHIVVVHHTITSPASLHAKWLHDPALSPKSDRRPRSGSKSPTPVGDILKTAAVVEEARQAMPAVRATLVLTTNQEVDPRLMTAAVAAGAEQGLEVDVWSRSRIAHVLDNTADGQWARRRLLGIDQDRLSRDLLAELSTLSANTGRPPDDPKTWIDRDLEERLAMSNVGATFVIGASGSGKSVACHRALLRHLKDGGFGLVVHDETIAVSPTLEVAIARTLKKLHPALAEGQYLNGVLIPSETLLVVIEDVNRSLQPQRLLEKIAVWSKPSAEGESWDRGNVGVRLLCPAWPSTVAALPDTVQTIIEERQLEVGPLTEDEGRAAVLARSKLAGQELSSADALRISDELGRDPLLIALRDPESSHDLRGVISRFVDRSLGRAQAKTSEPASVLRGVLVATARRMLERRSLQPSWSELTRWDLGAEHLHCLKQLTGHGEIVRLTGTSSDQRLLFRHDRVRDWLIVDALLEAESAGGMSSDLLSDPFLARIVAATLIRMDAPAAFLRRLKSENPLALFEALRLAGNGPCRSAIVAAIESWCADPDGAARQCSTMHWQAQTALWDVDGEDVLRLVRLLPRQNIAGSIAAMRNGDVEAGIAVSKRFGFGHNAAFRDVQVDHARLHHAEVMVEELGGMLRRGIPDAKRRNAALSFAGQLADRRLAPAIAECWEQDASRGECLKAYLWASAKCCDDANAASLLGPICDAWAGLSDERSENGMPSPRDELAADELRFGLNRRAPGPAVRYLVGRMSDPALRWPITYLLHGVDEPLALATMVDEMADMRRNGKDGHFSAMVIDSWRPYRRRMSDDGRALMLTIWRNVKEDPVRRCAAFDMWAAARDPRDLSILRRVDGDADLGDRVLKERLRRGDRSATQALIRKLDEEGGWWWHEAQNVPSPELVSPLDRALAARAETLISTDREEANDDWLLSDMLVRMPATVLEDLLSRHWSGLCTCPRYVQAALYAATNKLRTLAAEAIAAAAEPKQIFKLILSLFGVRDTAHPGIQREAQILALEPYLDLLDERELEDLADACNEGGWFATRRRLLDERLPSNRYCWHAEEASAEFDRMAAERHHWIDHEIDDALKTGATWAEYRDTLAAWFEERRSLEALRLVAAALRHKGTRDDLSLLRIDEAMPPEAAHELIDDTVYAVRLRTFK